MEKVQQAERGLRSCLELGFLAKLPKAISPKEGPEEQSSGGGGSSGSSNSSSGSSNMKRAPLRRRFDLYLCVLWILFILLCKCILPPTHLTWYRNVFPWHVGDMVWEKEAKGCRRTKYSYRTPQVCKFHFVLISELWHVPKPSAGSKEYSSIYTQEFSESQEKG